MRVVSVRWWSFLLFVAGYFFLFWPRAQYPGLVILTFIPTSLALWFGVLSLIGNDGRRKLYDPVTLLNLSMVYYSLKGVALSWGDRTAFLSHISMSRVEQLYPVVALSTAVAIIVWNLGYEVANRSRSARSQAKRQCTQGIDSGKEQPYVNPRLGVAFLIVVGGFSFYYLIQTVGGNPFAFVLESWRRGYLADTSLSGSSSAFASLLLPGVMVLPVASLLWLAILGNNRQRPGLLFWIYTGLMVFVLFLAMPRATLVGSLLSLLFVYHVAIRPVRPAVLLLSGLAGFLYVYVAGVWRIISSGISNLQRALPTLLDNLSAGDLPDFIFSGAIADIRIFVLIVNHYGNDVALKYGETLVRVLYQFVPRALWPGKPLDLGVELGRLSNADTISGTPAGLLAELYMNFHIVGVLAGVFLLGVALNYVYRRWVRYRQQPVLPIVFYAILIPRILLLPSNTFSIAFVSLAIPIGAAWVAYRLCLADKTTVRLPRTRRW